MNISRRRFFIGGAAFATLGAFAGNRFALAADPKSGAVPRLRFGVLSDIHITHAGADEKIGAYGNYLTFKRALEWFRSQNVDAVVIAGDMADCGLDENLIAVSDAWYSVFPDDKYPDGRSVEKVFATGNHDWIGWTYGGAAAKKYPDEAERVKHILQKDMAGWWRRLFREEYSPLYSKTVKGFTFIGAHWDDAQSPTGRLGGNTGARFAKIEDFMAKNGKKLDPSLPFFYIQHPHPKDTCYGPWAWGRDAGIVTKTLSAFPNAVAFSGHSHYSLTDERSVWQGAFTSVGTGSLRYTAMPNEEVAGGFENTYGGGKDAWRINALKTRKIISGGDCRNGMLWSVYDDCIVVKRREFLSGLDLGEDWTMPLTTAESRPFAFAERAKKLRAPEFPQGAVLEVAAQDVKIRGGKSRDGAETIPSDPKPGFKVTAPAAVPDPAARLFEIEFVAESSDGKRCAKRLLAEGFNHSPGHKKAKSKQWCYFRREELGEGDLRFTATPSNCFGTRGKPLVREYKV